MTATTMSAPSHGTTRVLKVLSALLLLVVGPRPLHKAVERTDQTHPPGERLGLARAVIGAGHAPALDKSRHEEFTVREGAAVPEVCDRGAALRFRAKLAANPPGEGLA